MNLKELKEKVDKMFEELDHNSKIYDSENIEFCISDLDYDSDLDKIIVKFK